MRLLDIGAWMSREEHGCRKSAQVLALRAGVQIHDSGRTVMLVQDGREQVLCTPTRNRRRWRETWAELRKRFPLLAGF
jgi:hypothetical protein